MDTGKPSSACQQVNLSMTVKTFTNAARGMAMTRGVLITGTCTGAGKTRLILASRDDAGPHVQQWRADARAHTQPQPLPGGNP